MAAIATSEGASNGHRPAPPKEGPSLSSLQYDRDAALDARSSPLQDSRAQARRERRDQREEERDERATGRERVIEKRKERNAERRGYERDREEMGMEVDDATLMGGSNDGFKAAYALTLPIVSLRAHCYVQHRGAGPGAGTAPDAPFRGPAGARGGSAGVAGASAEQGGRHDGGAEGDGAAAFRVTRQAGSCKAACAAHRTPERPRDRRTKEKERER